MKTLYEELELARTASPDAIQAMFGRLAAQASHNMSDADRMSRLVNAYRVLSDPGRRADYDRSLGLPPEERRGTSSGTRVAAPFDAYYAGRPRMSYESASGDRTRPTVPGDSRNASDVLERFLAKPSVALFVGPRFDTFALSWRNAFRKSGDLNKVESTASWSWGAFLFGPFYFCYRKMWKWAALSTGVSFLCGLVSIAGQQGLGSGANLGLSAVMAVLANGGYFAMVREKLRQIETAHTDSSVQASMAAAMGGVSWMSAIFGGLLCILIAISPEIVASAGGG